MTATGHGSRPDRRVWADEIRATLALALPLVATQVGQIAIQTTDVLMLARVGPETLAAAVLGIGLNHAVFLFALGVVSASATLAAQAKGARDPRGVRRSIRQGLWAAAAVGFPSMAVLWATEPILLLAGQAPATAAAAGAYQQAMLWGLPGALVFVVVRGFVSVVDRPRAAMGAMLACVALNAVLDWLLIFGPFGLPALGIVGAGIASAVGNSAMGFGLLGFALLDRRMRRYRLLAHFWRPDGTRLAAIFRIGVPIGLGLLAELGMFLIAGLLMGWVGVTELAAHGVALQIAAITFMVPLGIGLAAQVRVGRAAGAGDGAGVRRAGWTALALGAVAMGAAALLMVTVPERLAGLFLDPDDAASLRTAQLAAGFLVIGALFQLADGGQVVAAHALRGLGDTRVPMLLAAAGYWGIGLVSAWALAFPAGLGAPGIWWGMALGLVSVAFALIARFYWMAAPRRAAWLPVAEPLPATLGRA